MGRRLCRDWQGTIMKQKGILLFTNLGIIGGLIGALVTVFIFEPLSGFYLKYFPQSPRLYSWPTFLLLILLVGILPRLLGGVVAGVIARKKGWFWGALSGLLSFSFDLISGSIILRALSIIIAFITYLPFASLGGLLGEQLSKRVITKMFRR